MDVLQLSYVYGWILQRKKYAITIFTLQNIVLYPRDKPGTYQTTTLHVFINLSKDDKYIF